MFKFDNKISIDGIAVIIAAIGAIVWLVRLEGEVKEHEKIIVSHEQKIDRLSDATIILQQNIAVINAIQSKAKP